MDKKEKELHFEQIITKAWNDYKGAVTAYAVLNNRFQEDLKKISDPTLNANFKKMHSIETSKSMTTINNHFNHFQKIYYANAPYVCPEFCNKIDREITDIKALLKIAKPSKK